MFKFNDYSIKAKLIIIFIIFKILPLLLLSTIGIMSFLEIENLLHKSSKKIIKKSQISIEKTTNSAISDSIKALDKKSQEMLEIQTVMIANEVADFLKERDKDILFLATSNITKKTLKNFFDHKKRYIHLPIKYYYDEKRDGWFPEKVQLSAKDNELAQLKDNATEFHKVNPKPIRKKLIPIYKEITFYGLDGREIYKISSIDSSLKDISIKTNTYCRAEEYYKESLKLKKGEIYVSNVIGEYIPSPIIGPFTKAKAKKAGILFEPQKYGYAGAENPLGKEFEGIVRFVTPVYKNKKQIGFLSLALDHRHIMDFVDYKDPLSAEPLEISDASRGNYAFMWDVDFRCISHPRDYFIVGYDKKTGKMVPGWIDSELASAFKKSKENNLGAFLERQPPFLNQSLDKKPNLDQLKIGQVALDCRYLNFAPQCQGWSQLVSDGGYGSFIIFWSGLWKLVTAATIPYYTGQYKESKRGFGFVSIGANVKEFHKAATKTKEKIDKIFDKEKNKIKESITQIIEQIHANIKSQINKISLTTLILTIIVIYVAIFLSNYISKRIKGIIVGTKKLKNKKFNYKIDSDSKDELGTLADSFNEMAESIYTLNKDLQKKLYTDDLTKLKNRRAFSMDIKNCKDPILYLTDIDFFKNINDYYGADAGNFILIEFANMLKEFALQNQMSIYRLGSDEFLILQDNEFNKKEAKNVIENLIKILSKKRFVNKKLHIDTTMSITCGISCGEGSLLEKADLALNEAKSKKVSYMFYNNNNPHMNKYKENILWRKKIQYAISNDMIVPFFQPIIDMKNPKNKKYESLIRMIDDNKIISPYLFLDIAKEAKLYPELTKIMVEKTFKIFDTSEAEFALNLSVDDITNSETVEFIYKKLNEYDVRNKLTFELLESEEISDFDTILSFIKKMKSLGVKFAIDDFGSGYSNFSYLLQIQPDFIKIDGSLIKNIATNANSYHIVNAIVEFAKVLNIKIVAEFVSSQEIVDVLKDFDVDYMQGFHFAEPSKKL